MNRSVNWPAFIRYDGDTELTFITDHDEWQSDADLSFFGYSESDRLIDSSGQLFSLARSSDDSIVPEPLSESMTIEQVTSLLREHLSVRGECCVSKINPGSITACMEMLAHEQEP